ncbi:ABC transporter permease [Paenibacillus baimaensis]
MNHVNGNAVAVASMNHTARKKSVFRKKLFKERWLYLMLVPGILYFLTFKYAPMFGLVMAFQNYQPFLGFFKSEWVGFQHFQRFFTDPAFWMLFKNTITLGLLNIVFFFPLPIILALMLNELRWISYRRVVQTLVYIPHFVSWVVVSSLTYTIFTTEGGLANELLVSMGFDKINPLMTLTGFRPMIVLQFIWKETGWGTIIFLAAIASVNPELYKAAEVDGAGRWRKLWHITLPSIRSTIVILLILRLGTFLDTGFEQLLLMINTMNRELGEVFDTYVYQMGIVGGQFSYTAAVGLFKSVAALLLIVISNTIAKWFGEEGIY